MSIERIGQYLVAAIAAILVALFLFSIVLVLIGQFSTRARAHDWYTGQVRPGTNISCCNDRDCRPLTDADEFTIESGGYRFRHNGQLFPFDKTYPSQDERFHGCILPDGTVVCLFVPKLPGS